MNLLRPELLGILAAVASFGCSDSKEIERLRAACNSSGKYDSTMCRCIAEGAVTAETPEMVTQWLEVQLAAPAGTPFIDGVSPTLKTREYLRFVDRVNDPQLFCDRREN